MSHTVEERVRALMVTSRSIAVEREHSPMCFLLLQSGTLAVCPLVTAEDRVAVVRDAITTVRAAGATIDALVWVGEAWLSAASLDGFRVGPRREALVVTVDEALGPVQVHIAMLGIGTGEGPRKLGEWFLAPGLADGSTLGLLEEGCADAIN